MMVTLRARELPTGEVATDCSQICWRWLGRRRLGRRAWRGLRRRWSRPFDELRAGPSTSWCGQGETGGGVWGVIFMAVMVVVGFGGVIGVAGLCRWVTACAGTTGG